jgi:hypothetical protein
VTISYAEMGVALNAWSYAITVKQLNRMLVVADKNNSGQISVPEFEKIILNMLRNKLAKQGIVDKLVVHHHSAVHLKSGTPYDNSEHKNEEYHGSLVYRRKTEDLSDDEHSIANKSVRSDVEFGIPGQYSRSKRNAVSDNNAQSFAGLPQIHNGKHLVSTDFEYITEDSCSHEDLVAYTNQLIAANEHVYNVIGSMRDIMNFGPKV